MILALLGMLYNVAKSEWVALRSDVRALQQQVAAQPTGEQFRELTHRVDLIERQVNRWDE
jgi:polyhydroxyalkanoate synthesis regulator phasin